MRLLFLKRTGLILLALAIAVTGLSTWWGIYRAQSVPPDEAFDTAMRWQPWGGPAWIPAATRTLTNLNDPERRAEILQNLARHYPLTASLWLERAELALTRQESSDTINQFLTAAVAIEPGNTETRWKAAMIALQAGNQAMAWEHLREFVSLRPHEIERVTLLARRWLNQPALFLDTIVPNNPDALRRLLTHAANWGDWDLAAEIWQRLPDQLITDTEVAGAYPDRLLQAGYGREAVRVWRRVEPGFVAGVIQNGDFTLPLQQRSVFDWRIQPQAGVEIQRDEREFVSEPAALHLQFDGSENLRLSSPAIFIVVEPGQTYELTGRWRAAGLTTQALPYWLVTGYHHPDRIEEGVRRVSTLTRHYTDAAGGDWPWEEFATVIEVPEDIEVIRIQLQRDPTQNFDRLLAGDLWIDDVAINLIPIRHTGESDPQDVGNVARGQDVRSDQYPV
ncbi:MAG: hypothetical protein WD356_01920, partial [Pseudomonadales bacterium]